MKLTPAKAITDIGLDYGYSASNYSSVFRKHHDTSPAMFRQSMPIHSMAVPFTPDRVVHFRTAEEYASQIEIQNLDDIFVPYKRFIGNYVDLEKNWCQFLDEYKAFLNEKTILAERFFNDHFITNPAQCICDICMTVEQDCELSNGIWLPQSNYRMTRRYGLNIYRCIDWDNHRVVMDLCIPVS